MPYKQLQFTFQMLYKISHSKLTISRNKLGKRCHLGFSFFPLFYGEVSINWKNNYKDYEMKSRKQIEQSEGGKLNKNLFVLTESDPNMEFIHWLPEYEGPQRHCKERRHFHHLLLFNLRSSSLLQIVIREKIDKMRRGNSGKQGQEQKLEMVVRYGEE